jgi:MoaA/NifB/PqqE/SkfB family radical SAM enzyme
MITNGYLLNADRIERLNQAGLDHMQISIDNLEPDAISKKSLKLLDKKLQMLAEFAEFHVNINSVVGGGFRDPNDALVIGRRALELGFTSTIGIIHDSDGQLKPLEPGEAKVYEEMSGWKKVNYSRFDDFQAAIAKGRPNDWRCRAGSRYLYICEDGLVHYCSQQRGYPGVPLAGYTTADVEREFLTAKSCAPNCTIGCVHKISYIDHWRAPQTRMVSPDGQVLVKIQTGARTAD